jgi:hypothetical protein
MPVNLGAHARRESSGDRLRTRRAWDCSVAPGVALRAAGIKDERFPRFCKTERVRLTKSTPPLPGSAGRLRDPCPLPFSHLSLPSFETQGERDVDFFDAWCRSDHNHSIGVRRPAVPSTPTNKSASCRPPFHSGLHEPPPPAEPTLLQRHRSRSWHRARSGFSRWHTMSGEAAQYG